MLTNENILSIKTVITPQELMKVLGISKTTAYNLVHSDSFPSFQVGNKYLISVEGLKKWIDLQIDK